MAGQPAARPPEAERFVRDFARVWSAATPTGFSALFDPSIRLIAPLIPVTDGIRAAEAGFADLLGLLPDLAAEVHDWAPTADGVIIDHVFRGTLGRHRVCWRG
ncbi:MAG TPA: nuclear transport factor 2 family protein, partial [Baekduia sp.]|nr:nuclear transport factor 2 family protein [Baekduia sp.]